MILTPKKELMKHFFQHREKKNIFSLKKTPKFAINQIHEMKLDLIFAFFLTSPILTFKCFYEVAQQILSKIINTVAF